jgi:DNA mismatch endonuclease (patch repair protein)
MTDRLTPAQRHRCMSHIRSKDTKPEMIVRRYLFAHGFRYRLHVSTLPGKPDIVLRKYRTVVFVNGCFWHGHEGCKYATIPEKNSDFWKAKIEANKARDLNDRLQLKNMGWHVIQIWQCQLKPKEREKILKALEYTLNEIMLINFKKETYLSADDNQTTTKNAAEDMGGYE